MAVRGTKHSGAEQRYFSDFSGGLNLSLPAEAIGANEFQEALNFEYDSRTGGLKLRDGLVLMGTLPAAVSDIAPVAGSDALLVRTSDKKLYKLADYSLSGPYDVLLLGDKVLSYALWGDANELVLCAGEKLYLYKSSDDSFVKVDSSPASCDFCFVRAGRVVVASADSDSLMYSGVGDVFNWQFETVQTAGADTADDASDDVFDTWVDSDAVSLEVGYKDGCDMAAAAPLSTDIVVFKRPAGQPGQGRIYRVTGEYPDWVVKQQAVGASAWNSRSCATTTDDLLFLTSEGVASLGTVSDYGDVRMKWAGAKVNPRIASEVGSLCRVWKMTGAGQVWVMPAPSARLYVYTYALKAWTEFEFPGVVTDACEVGRYRYVAVGHQVFRLDPMFGTDNGNAFTGRLKFQGIRKHGMVLIKQFYVAYDSMAASEVCFVVNGHRVALPFGGQLHDVAVLDDDVAALDDSFLVSSFSASVRSRVNIRVWDGTAELEVQRGPFCVNAVGLEVSEV